MKKKKIAALALAGLLIGTAVSIAGCSPSEKEEIVENAGEAVVEVNGKKISMNEMMYYIYQTEQEGNYYEEFYQSYFQSSYWDMEYEEGKTFRDVAKEDTMDSAVMYTIFEEKAKEAGYSLDEEETKMAAEDAQTLYDSLSEAQRETMGLTVEQIAAIQEKVLLGNKYYDEVMEGIIVVEEEATSQVNSEEYKEYAVSYIYIPTVDYDDDFNMTEYSKEDKEEAYEIISALLPEASKAEDFDELILEENEALEAGEISFLEGDELFGAAFEEAALELEKGQVADHIIEEEDGYYIVKMVDDNSTESYDSAVEEAIANAQYEEFQREYQKMKEDYDIKINDSLWEDIVIGDILYEPMEDSSMEESDELDGLELEEPGERLEEEE